MHAYALFFHSHGDCVYGNFTLVTVVVILLGAVIRGNDVAEPKSLGGKLNQIKPQEESRHSSLADAVNFHNVC